MEAGGCLIVLSIGGSILNPGKPNLPLAREIAGLLSRVHKQEPLAVVVGGGAPARAYAKAVRERGGSYFDADIAAIRATRENAELLRKALGKHAYGKVPKTFEEAGKGVKTGKIVVMGGTIPGITTDADSALLAEMAGAKRLINVSNVDGIYSADPKKDKSARKFPTLTHNGLIELAVRGDSRVAGEHFVFDLVACKIIARSGIEAHFVGADLAQAEAACLGKRHSGTVVR